MIKISIIIPIFNGEKYIESIVNNLQSQSLTDFEIILINDGSTDNTLDICNKLAKIDNRINVIDQKNSGVSSARNQGIKSAKGEYLCFIDCDDYINSNYLESLYNACENHSVKMSACIIESVKVDGSLISRKSMKENKYSSQTALEALFNFKDLNCGPCGKLFHKSLFKEELVFPNMHTYEDLLFVYKAIYFSKEIYFTESCKYYYIHRDGIGAMDKFIKNPTVDVIIAANEILDFIKICIPQILETSFYGIISQVIMYINDINKVDKKWEKNNSKNYISLTQKLLRKYRKQLILNKNIFLKEKILFIIFSYSSKLYKKIIDLRTA